MSRKFLKCRGCREPKILLNTGPSELNYKFKNKSLQCSDGRVKQNKKYDLRARKSKITRPHKKYDSLWWLETQIYNKTKQAEILFIEMGMLQNNRNKQLFFRFFHRIFTIAILGIFLMKYASAEESTLHRIQVREIDLFVFFWLKLYGS